jgi:hypothetical protein
MALGDQFTGVLPVTKAKVPYGRSRISPPIVLATVVPMFCTFILRCRQSP